MFSKSKLSSAVTIAMGASAVTLLSMHSVQADSIFFPHLVNSPTVTSIVSVVNTGTAAASYDVAGNPWVSGAGAQFLHYRLYTKGLTGVNAVDNQTACEEFNDYLTTSPNDIQTMDLSGEFDAGTLGVLFNDPSVQNNWVAQGRDFALARNILPSRGYLLVDNASADVATTTLSGEAFIFEFASGAAWGYQAHKRGGDAAGVDGEFDYVSVATEQNTQLNLLPFDEFTTAFLATAVNYKSTPTTIDGVVRPVFTVDPAGMVPEFENKYAATLALRTATSAVLFDRDEGPVSGGRAQSIVCVGRIDATDLLAPGIAERIPDGGWGNLWNNAGSAFASTMYTSAANSTDAYTGAVVIKLEYNQGPSFNGQPASGVFNNAMMLRPATQVASGG